MAKAFCLILIFAYLVGAIFGFVSTVTREPVIAIAIAVLAVMAFPVARNAFNELRR